MFHLPETCQKLCVSWYSRNVFINSFAGRSMGARAAVGVCNDIQGSSMEHFVLGVICISYPLHTPKDTANLRDGPLLQLNKHCLFISGNSDEMCNSVLMENVLSKVPISRIVWLPEADHGLKVKREPEAVTVEKVGLKILEWVRGSLTSITIKESTKPAPAKKGKRKADASSKELKQEDRSDMVKTDEKQRMIESTRQVKI